MWRLTTRGGLTFAVCRALEAVPGLCHAFSTRRGAGGRDFDVGPHDGPGFLERGAALCLAAGLTGRRPVVVRQVHGSEVVPLDEAAGSVAVEADGVIELVAHRQLTSVPAVRTADCVPVLLADRQGQAAAAVHAGWRGTGLGIVRRAVESFREAGVPPGRLVVGLGPAIGRCCYVVGEDVVEAVAGATAGPRAAYADVGEAGETRIDLRAALRIQLQAAGCATASIHAADWCTRCSADLFHSYRRDGAAAGRQLAVVGRTSRQPGRLA